MTVERYLESDPTMPRSVAEYLAERAARAYETKPERRTLEAGFARDLASMSAVRILAYHLWAQDAGVQFDHWLEEVKRSNPEYLEEIDAVSADWRPRSHVKILGEIVREPLGWVVQDPGSSELDPAMPCDRAPRVWVLRRTGLDPGARIALLTLVRYSIAMIGSVTVFSTLGISWSNVQWLAAALTFGLGFGLQEIVANFVSGIILLAERPVRVGDAVTIGNLSGLVSRIRIRSTTISLWDRSEMIVPNKEFITQKLVNWTLSDSRTRVDVPLRVAYGTDVEKVKRVLLEVARAHTPTFDEPAPKALLLEFGESCMQFELRVFVDYRFGRVRAKDELQVAIDKAFREAGIDFALPSYRVQSDTGEEKAIAPPPKDASDETSR